MKKLRKLWMFALIAGLIFGFAGCKDDGTNPGSPPVISPDPEDENPDSETNQESEPVSFDSFLSPSIYVDNNSDERLVAFKGSLNLNNLISGIAPGNTCFYQGRMGRNPDDTYPASLEIPSLQETRKLKIGTPENMLEVPTNTYKRDYLYKITITGSDASTLALGEIEDMGVVGAEAFFLYGN